MSENLSAIFIQQRLRLTDLTYQSLGKTDITKQLVFDEFTIDILRWNCVGFTYWKYHIWGRFSFIKASGVKALFAVKSTPLGGR